MNKEFIPYEEALALKELGFDEECFNRFYTKPNSKMFGLDEHGRSYPIKNTSKKLYTIGEHATLNGVNVISAPLYQQAFRWFRDDHDLQTSNIMFSNGKHDTGITRYKGTQSVWGYGPIYDTYEEAELACLKKLIEIVNQNKEDEL